MKPENSSNILLAITKSKAKMYECSIPEEKHIAITSKPSQLAVLAISIVGDVSAQINSGEINYQNLSDQKKSLEFASQFFDSYLNSRLDSENDSYLMLVASAAYYLCDLPGSSSLLAGQIQIDEPDLEGGGLDAFLIWLLKGNFSEVLLLENGIYAHLVNQCCRKIINFYGNGKNSESILEALFEIREMSYQEGTARELLFADVACAVAKKRLESSCWSCLPKYSAIPSSQWEKSITKPSFFRELWPAQKLIGDYGVYQGRSAVIQMPTSAGKTKSTEIIIRSAFLSGRASMVVLVAPFRALCHEIRSNLGEAFKDENVSVVEVSDVPQVDESTLEMLKFFGVDQVKRVLVLTPEKLFYLLRQVPKLAESIGLVIYDEGHQFDNGSRGVTYELLLASLNSMLPDGVQKVLISAIMSNAGVINSWLNGANGLAIAGANLLPTSRSVAFASWQDGAGSLGSLQFVDPDNIDERKFYVPWVIERIEFQSKIGRKRNIEFPSRIQKNSVAIYLGLRLVKNGGVALFCGRKSSVHKYCKDICEYYARGLPITPPVDFSNKEEIKRLVLLHQLNLGEEAAETKCSQLGIFSHSGSTPHGLRVSIEHAMQSDLIRFVICTSTLAQGVNLPIRYLIVNSIYQANERIKVRDFHNLIGRAGRSGMYTEGSIIFADPQIWDFKNPKSPLSTWNLYRGAIESQPLRAMYQ